MVAVHIALPSTQKALWQSGTVTFMAHRFIIGRSGYGKSTLLKEFILDDIYAGRGVFFIDPHGEDIDDLLQFIPKNRRQDVILFDPSDYKNPMAWNPFSNIEKSNRPLVASSFVDTIKDAWGYGNQTTPKMDMYLYNTISSLLDVNGTMLEAYLMLTSSKYRETVLSTSDVIVRRFWERYETMNVKDKLSDIDSTFNKIQTLVSDPRIRNVLGQNKSAFSFSDILEGKIFLARLPQGSLGLSKSSLIGSLLLSQLHISALGRTDFTPFGVYIDEAHHFAPCTLKEMLSGVRKYGIQLTVSHQYLDQLPRELKSSVLANTQDHYIFNVSKEDAKELDQVRGFVDLNELEPFNYRTYQNLKPVDRWVEPCQRRASNASLKQIISNNRRNYCRPVHSVEKEIDALLKRF